MISMQNNPVIYSPDQPTQIQLAQTRETLVDTDIYSKFIYSCENRFRMSRFYRNYKHKMFTILGNRDAMKANINGEMTDIELHHHFPTLKQAAIMITEHTLNHKGCVTTNEVVAQIKEAHRNNLFAIIFLTETEHQVYHADPTYFISLNQCAGNPYKFLDMYIDGITLDIAFNMLYQLKMEEQHNGKSFTPNMVRAREQIKSFSGLGG